MKRIIVLGVLASAVAVMPALSETAPAAVTFSEGSVVAPLSDAPGDPAAGATVMTTAALGNCVACHTISAMPDVQFQGNVGPTLDGAADRYDEAHLRGMVVNAKQTFEVTVMPPFYKTEGFIRPGAAYTGKAPEGDLPPILTAQQVEDVVAYLLTLKE
ncbi:sulfur oxidation c-type cytochrome SoxX [Paracoccaceae bacterium Fryx2]|nr:sulfur oxidation c-type cytochrome SoxX [Paracoccaceae bacterium Fryx2]